MSLGIVIALVVAYLGLLLFAIALLTAAKRGDEAMERDGDVQEMPAPPRLPAERRFERSDRRAARQRSR